MKHFEEKGGINKEYAKPIACMTGKRNCDNDWVVDSGSTEHITHAINILENITKNHFESPVHIHSGENIHVEGKGEYMLPGGLN